jgi:multicomponent Na+:H+ antiporter subunit D
MSSYLAVPIVVPLAAAAVGLIAGGRERFQQATGLAGSLGVLLAGIGLVHRVLADGVQAMAVGGWPAPFGITLVADLLSAILVLVAGLLGTATVAYSFRTIDAGRTRFGYYPLLNVLLMGVCGAFLTGDLFNLYVWFEVLLIASFVLMALGGERAQIEGAIKYVALNLISSAVFLAALGLLYGRTGTLNMAHLSSKVAEMDPGFAMTLAGLFLVAFGIKAAMFPLFFWLPASYHTPPVAVSAIFSGLLTKVGVYSLVRTFTIVFGRHIEGMQAILEAAAGLTMLTGVLGAVAQTEFRRLLSFHIVSQIGYLLMGLSLFSSPAFAATVFFLVHVILAKSALFLVSGIAHRIRGTYDLRRLGGLYVSHPGLATLFLLPALSLAGVPPLSGFVAKVALLRAGLDSSRFTIVAAALVTSILTLYSMMKIWSEAFWKQPPDDGDVQPRLPSRKLADLLVPAAAVGILTLFVGLLAGPLWSVAERAGGQLADPSEYVRAVLEERR